MMKEVSIFGIQKLFARESVNIVMCLIFGKTLMI